jgi:hypothetical protein
MSNIPKLTVEKSLHVGDWDPTHRPPQPPPDIPGLTTINGPCWYGAGLSQNHGWVKLLERHDKALVGIVPPTRPRYDTLGSAPAQRSAWPNTGEWYGPFADALTISKQGNPLIGQQYRYDGVGIRVNANAHKIESKDLTYFTSEKEIHLIADKLPEGSDFLTSDGLPKVKMKLSKDEEKILGIAPKIELKTNIGDQIHIHIKEEGSIIESKAEKIDLLGETFCNKNIIAAKEIKSNNGSHVLSAKKDFDIPHPTKEGWRLTHACVEGPEAAVYVRGKLKDANIIELPEYWTKLVDPDSITVSLTPIGIHQELYVSHINDNKIFVRNNNGVPTNCFYHIYAERIDTEKLIPEYEGSIEDYPGDNNQRSIVGYHYDRKK